jgi:glycosyltransferase involved in cell wall biosynthesis
MEVNELEISVVLPCLNEESTIGSCITKIKEVFSREGIKGEIIVVDNGSIDKSVEIALNLGIKVIYEPIQGYGAAYLKGLGEAKGKFIIMGDADGSYNFYEIPKFIKLLREGYDLVLGSRFKGKIHKGAMPLLNRYFGNPILSGMCRMFFHTNLTDIHCGMRAITKEAHKRMSLKCLGMEFATEMVVVALQKRLRVTEVPVEYYPRKGRSKLRPFRDAWRHARFMLLFCPTWLYLLPGSLLTLFGFLILTLLVKGPFLFLGHAWDIHMMVLGALLAFLGFQLLNLGVFAKAFAIQQGYLKQDRIISPLIKYFRLEIGILIGGILFLIGLGINIFIFLEWWKSFFGALYRIRESILAMTLMVLGLQIVFSSFFVNLLTLKR